MDLQPRRGMDAAAVDALVARILAEATLAEKVGMMSGRGFFKAWKADGGVWGARPYRAGGGIERLGVPCFWFSDGPRGVARGQSTCFPCVMARGASFDAGLERRIGEAMGLELRAQGCNLSGAVCINLLRHPAWGRAQETYGEDPVHLGVMGRALAGGLQVHNVAATVKHFALNSMENMRFEVDVRIDERALHEVYLPHFKAVVDAGVMSVMSAYNRVNGEYCGENARLLTGILREDWGFEGFVHSDWVKGVYTVQGAVAGLDVENPEPLVWGDRLLAAVEAGDVPLAVVDRACGRILRALYAVETAVEPRADYGMGVVACAEHVALALEAAEKSAVLLVNDGVLPLAAGVRLAVLGRLAGVVNTGDNGSSRVRAPYVVTVLEGLRRVFGDVLTGDEGDLVGAAEAAAAADVAVVVVGYTAAEEGEYITGELTLGQDGTARAIGGDRVDLGLPASQVALIEAALASATPVVVVIVAGSAVMVEGWGDRVSAVLQSFYAGMEGGTALARLLCGMVSPSGRLPFTVARDVADYPWFDRDAAVVTYDHWHGYAKLARDGVRARFPFGHGLGYSRFETGDLTVERVGNAVVARAVVRHVGGMAGEHVVMLWAESPGGVQPFWGRKLVGFARVALEVGEAAAVEIVVPLERLMWRDAGVWRLEAGDWRVLVAGTAEAGAEAEVVVQLR